MISVNKQSYFYKMFYAMIVGVSLMICLQGNSVQADSIKIIVHGNELQTDVPPILIEGRVMVPLKAIFDAVEADTVVWDGNTKTVVAAKGETVIVLRIDDKLALTNDGLIELDVAPKIVDGRTMVPARFIAESLNLDVLWLSDEKTVVVTDKVSEQWEYYATKYVRIPFSVEDSARYKIETDDTTITVEFDEQNFAYIGFIGKYPMEFLDYLSSILLLESGKIWDNEVELTYLRSEEIKGGQGRRFSIAGDYGMQGEYIMFHDQFGNFFQAIYAFDEQSSNTYVDKFENILERMVILEFESSEIVYETVDTSMLSFNKKSDWEYTTNSNEIIESHVLESDFAQSIQLYVFRDNQLMKDAMPTAVMQMGNDVENLQKTEYIYKGLDAVEYTFEHPITYKRYDGEDAEITTKAEIMLIEINDDCTLFIAVESLEQMYDETYEIYMELLDSLVIKSDSM